MAKSSKKTNWLLWGAIALGAWFVFKPKEVTLPSEDTPLPPTNTPTEREIIISD